MVEPLGDRAEFAGHVVVVLLRLGGLLAARVDVCPAAATEHDSADSSADRCNGGTRGAVVLGHEARICGGAHRVEEGHGEVRGVPVGAEPGLHVFQRAVQMRPLEEVERGTHVVAAVDAVLPRAHGHRDDELTVRPGIALVGAIGDELGAILGGPVQEMVVEVVVDVVEDDVADLGDLLWQVDFRCLVAQGLLCAVGDEVVRVGDLHIRGGGVRRVCGVCRRLRQRRSCGKQRERQAGGHRRCGPVRGLVRHGSSFGAAFLAAPC